MTPYIPADTFAPTINTYDIVDAVIGGSSGISNNPVKALADRSQYLYNRLGRYLGQRNITTADTIIASDKYKLLKVVSSANISLTLSPLADFAVGDIITVKAKTTANGIAIRILPNGSETIQDGLVNLNTAGLFLHDGEMVKLIAADADGNGIADYWEFEDGKGNFNKVGVDDLVRVVPRNCAIANGCNPESGGALPLRADYPRVWAAVSAAAIDDATWQSDIRYRGFFSTGNGSTTFRWPDMRSMVHKGLDLSRGLSLNRLDATDGGLEKDAILEHYHNTTINPNSNSQTGSGKVTVGGDANEGAPPSFKSGGAIDLANTAIGNSENLIKTIGFTPVIYY